MTDNPFGLVNVFVYFATVALSIPVSLVTYALSRRLGSFRDALVQVGVGVVAVVLAAATAIGLFVALRASALFVLLAGVALAVLGVFPILIGAQVLVRRGPLDSDTALEYATLGWPVALVASLVVFFAPGGPARYNITFLSGPVAVVAWAVMLLVVTFGPAVAGYGMYRLVERLR